ncbi:hypothetical protein UY3_17829 [Chelonia mydas]|uniref:Uncharacterized protein n=1 Tax=Chelonia mydas TaxID=8469 RepID=M7AZB5_CHEMY|nr:hypothetical protein UY3_17829 [Chelonia mydas]
MVLAYVTALDSTFNSDSLARYTGKALGTFEFNFLFGQHDHELDARGYHKQNQVTIQHLNHELDARSYNKQNQVTIQHLSMYPLKRVEQAVATGRYRWVQVCMELMGEHQQLRRELVQRGPKERH